MAGLKIPDGLGGYIHVPILQGKPEWTDVQNKPSTFPPSTHNHVAGDLSGVVPLANIPSNPNLLINSHFRSPINQRGSTDYTTNYAFTIDRWELLSGDPAGMHMYSYPNEDFIAVVYGHSGATYFMQTIEHPELITGTHTFSFEFVGETGASMLFYVETNSGIAFSKWYTGDGVWRVDSITGNIPAESTYVRVSFSIHSAGAFYLRWAKLERGSVATPLALRPYAEEFAMCKRYYEKIINSGTNGFQPITFLGMAASDGSKFALALFKWDIEKRILPTIKIKGALSGNTVSIRDANTNISASGILTIDSWDNQSKTGLIRLRLGSPTSDFVVGGMYEAIVDADAEIYV